MARRGEEGGKNVTSISMSLEGEVEIQNEYHPNQEMMSLEEEKICRDKKETDC